MYIYIYIEWDILWDMMRYTMGLWNIIILWDMMGFPTRMTGTTMGNGWKIFGFIFDDMFFSYVPFMECDIIRNDDCR